MKKIFLIIFGLSLLGCTKEEILPIPSPVISSSPQKVDYKYNTLSSNEVRLLSNRWDTYNGRGTKADSDFNNDGESDVVYIDDRIFARTYKNGTYLSSKIEGVSFVFARSIISFDANGDGYLDFLVMAHNDERIQPNPGEIPYLFINKGGNSFEPKKLNVKQDFWHLATAGDLDNDGDNDLIISTAGSMILLMNINGEFIETENIIPKDYKLSHYVGALVDDFNLDGYNDIIVFGHEFSILKDKTQLAYTRILYGNKSGIYTEDNSSIISEDKTGFGIVIDAVSLDLNKDGKKEIILVRTGDPINHSFYKGYKIQILNENIDVTAQFLNNSYSYNEDWICQIKLIDVNGDGKKDILEFDKRRDKFFLQK